MYDCMYVYYSIHCVRSYLSFICDLLWLYASCTYHFIYIDRCLVTDKYGLEKKEKKKRKNTILNSIFLKHSYRLALIKKNLGTSVHKFSLKQSIISPLKNKHVLLCFFSFSSCIE